MADFTVFYGPLVHSLQKDRISIVEKALIIVEDGKVTHLMEEGTLDHLESFVKRKSFKLKTLTKGQFLCPGFVDLHIHAPQFPNQGIGMDKPLLEWLESYTFPQEKNFKDVELASTVYRYIVNTTLSSGTTTCVYYATIHRQSSLILAKIADELGQRALVGKVNMNQNSPLDYVETTEQSIEEAEGFIQDVLNLKSSLVEPVITPRFAISCSMDLLKELGKLAKKYNTYVQTHIAENKAEVALTRSLFADFSSYADIYDKAGLLTPKTILAHGIYLTNDEKQIISSRGVCVAHCPNSNTCLMSGRCNVDKLWSCGINVGLGTDVSGGCNSSILDSMRHALATSINISFDDPNQKPLNYEQVFYMATLGGAKCLGKDKVIGSLTPGKEFDALIVDMELGRSPSGSLPSHTTNELFQKFIYSGDDRNIKEVYVKGKLVCCK